MIILKVTQPGAGISFQDQGRVGENSWLNYGVAPAGSLDPFSAAAANTLLHNLESDTVLELMLGGAELEVLSDCWLAHVGGQQCAKLPSWTARYVRAGEILRFGPSAHGAWSYLAITGGWQASKVFGSTSRHERSAIGDVVNEHICAISAQVAPHSSNQQRFTPHCDRRDFLNPPLLRLYRGPHCTLFSDQQFELLSSTEWSVSSRSDRTGYRLTGDVASSLQHDHSIHSTPTLVGSVQIPPSGSPIVTLNDGPTVGGYPIIGYIHPDDLGWLVQQHAHQTVHFSLT